MGKRQARRPRGRSAQLKRADGRPQSDIRVHEAHNPTGPPGTGSHKTGPSLPRHRLTLSDVFGRTFWIMAGAAAAAGALCWYTKGAQVFRDSLAGDVDLLLFIAPRFGAGMLIAAFAAILIPRDRIARYVSDGAGVRAEVIATAAGGLTPGGPMTAFPLVAALRDAGTGRSALIAYITSWSTMGFQRVLNWELPLLGPEFTLLRLVSSLPLPIIAGLTARLLPHPTAHSTEPPRDLR